MADGIEASRLYKSFGQVRAVDGVDFTITRGETVALLGPNGAGKTTVIDMLLGLLTPDAGAISVFGGSPGAAVSAGAVGAMLQNGGLIPDLSVRELVEMVASLYRRPLGVNDVLSRAGLEGAAEQRTQKLSGGQMQRVRFAVALVGNPELLVLDEPTVAMDVESRNAFWVSMRQLAAGGITILFATHYLEEADKYADRVVLLARGRVVADGPTTEIKAMVRARTIRVTLPRTELDPLTRLSGVSRVERHGDAVLLNCSDSDAAIRALLEHYPAARDIEIRGAALEQAFMLLTGVE